MDLFIEQKGRVLRLTLNRPRKRNALTTELCQQIVHAIASAGENPEIGAVLIGAHGQVFCAGMDLDEAVHGETEEMSGAHEALFTIGSRAKKPILVCVNGAALGGGLGLVTQGHIVIADNDAVFGMPEIRVGLWPFLIYRSVEAALGPRRTLELSLTGCSFTAAEAAHWGLVHRLSPPAETCERSMSYARDVAKSSPAAIAAGLEYHRLSRNASWDDAGKLAMSIRERLIQSDDFKEGVDAFKNKREPHWPSLHSSVRNHDR